MGWFTSRPDRLNEVVRTGLNNSLISCKILSIFDRWCVRPLFVYATFTVSFISLGHDFVACLRFNYLTSFCLSVKVPVIVIQIYSIHSAIIVRICGRFNS